MVQGRWIGGVIAVLGLAGAIVSAAEPESRWRPSPRSQVATSSPSKADVASTARLQQRIQELESENQRLKESQASSGPSRASSRSPIQLTGGEWFPISSAPPSDEAYIPSATDPPIAPPADSVSPPRLSVLVNEPLPAKKEAAAESTCKEHKPGEGDWKTKWNHGIEWSSPDKAFKVHIGGRTQFDTVFYNDSVGALIGAGGIASPQHDQDAIQFRRARLRADGTLYEMIDYAAEFDFTNSTSREAAGGLNTEGNTINVTAPTDLWFTFRELAFGSNLRVGNFKEPIGFEHATSSRYLNFMERSFLQDLYAGAFNNGFSPGIMVYNTWDEEYGTWWLGGFRNGQNIFGYDVGNGEFAATGRVTYTPLYCHECEKVVHVGFAGSVRDPDGDVQRFRARSLRNGPANLATIFADTGSFSSTAQYLGAAELVAVNGPWTFQSEWIGSWNSDAIALGTTSAVGGAGTNLGTVFTNSYYFELLYFLTGESREYERKNGAFGRVIPHQNFSWKNCCIEPGAWQLGFRYGVADLNDGALKGGYLQEYTVGLNWFLNPNMKVQFNYVALERDSPLNGVDGGIIHGFGMRLAHDF